MTECLAVIPARSGSKGIPRKNMRSVGGKPLLVHAIEAALGAKRVTRVAVSTDDADIAAVATSTGAQVINRPADISGDAATSESAVLHALATLADLEDYHPDLVMLIQCTSPMTLAQDLDAAVQTLEAHNADSCFTAVPFHHFLWNSSSDGTARGINHSGAKRKSSHPRRWRMAPPT